MSKTYFDGLNDAVQVIALAALGYLESVNSGDASLDDVRPQLAALTTAQKGVQALMKKTESALNKGEEK